VLVVVFLVLVAVTIAALISFRPGEYETYPRAKLMTPAQRAAAPSWTRPCWKTVPLRSEPTCAHTSGRVVWVQRRDGDGDGDRHFLIVSHLHGRIVKAARTLPVTDLPSIGTSIDAVGWLMVGAHGHDEIDAKRLVPGGPSGR
jgi:hypothetical protein